MHNTLLSIALQPVLSKCFYQLIRDKDYSTWKYIAC